METMTMARVKRIISCLFFMSVTAELFLSPGVLANVTTISFEELLGQDAMPIGTFYPGIRFEALSTGEDWIVSDITTGLYNVSSWPTGEQWNTGQYWIYDYAAAWTGQPGDGGIIIFENVSTVFVELGYCAGSQLTLSAYDALGNEIDSDSGPANRRYLEANGSGPGTLRVDAPVGQLISYVILHDSGNFWIIDNIAIGTALDFTKVDDVEEGDCRSPEESIVYTICFDNEYGQLIEDAYIIDYLPNGVTYPQGMWTLDPNDIFNPIPPDPGYDPNTHSYVWPIGTIDPNDSGCVQLTLTVNDKAEPGMYLHNVAELWGTITDPNTQETRVVLLAKATEDTLVCCWDTSGILYVDKNATGANTGLNWQDAYTDMQDALTRARETTCAEAFTIYVAQGTYRPEDTEDGFVLPEGVSVYGGFNTGGCDFSKRNPKRYETILTGLIDESTIADNVVTMGDETLLDGFTVTMGLASAVVGNGADFSIERCIIKDNFQLGINATNGNVSVQWCMIKSNGTTGIQHVGTECILTVDNSWIMRNGEFGVFCNGSTPMLRNSIISESDLMEQGREGIRLYHPKYQPILHNNTIANNKAEGISFFSNGDPNNPILPDVQNSIVYYNNNGGPQLAGIEADTVANFCCIQDCNTIGTTNINVEPGFAYTVDPNGTPDPNNYHLSVESLCIDSGNPFLSYTGQVDIDGEGLDRQYGVAVDIGADEVYDCDDDYLSEIDVHNDLDWDADGIVNLNEFMKFSRAWLSRSPDEFTDPNLVDPNAIANWNPICNLAESGNSQYVIDLADLCVFFDDWLWVACWKLDEINAAAASAQQENLPAQSISLLENFSANLLETTAKTVETQQEISVETLVQIIGFLNEAEVEMPDNIEAIEAVRAILVEQLSSMLSTEERQPLDISGEI